MKTLIFILVMMVSPSPDVQVLDFTVDGEPKTITVTARDFDEYDPVIISHVTDESGWIMSLTEEWIMPGGVEGNFFIAELMWTPDFDDVGQHNITFWATDSYGDTDNKQIEVTIHPGSLDQFSQGWVYKYDLRDWAGFRRSK